MNAGARHTTAGPAFAEHRYGRPRRADGARMLDHGRCARGGGATADRHDQDIGARCPAPSPEAVAISWVDWPVRRP